MNAPRRVLAGLLSPVAVPGLVFSKIVLQKTQFEGPLRSKKTITDAKKPKKEED